MTGKQYAKWLLLGGAIALVLALVFYLGRSCAPTTVIEEPNTTIDTREVDKATHEAEKLAREQSEKMIENLEETHSEDLEKFDEQQKREYEEVRKQGPNAVADWLTEFNRSL